MGRLDQGETMQMVFRPVVESVHAGCSAYCRETGTMQMVFRVAKVFRPCMYVLSTLDCNGVCVFCGRS